MVLTSEPLTPETMEQTGKTTQGKKPQITFKTMVLLAPTSPMSFKLRMFKIAPTTLSLFKTATYEHASTRKPTYTGSTISKITTSRASSPAPASKHVNGQLTKRYTVEVTILQTIESKTADAQVGTMPTSESEKVFEALAKVQQSITISGVTTNNIDYITQGPLISPSERSPSTPGSLTTTGAANTAKST